MIRTRGQLQVIDGIYDIYVNIIVALSNGAVPDITKLYDNTALSGSIVRATPANVQSYYKRHQVKIDSIVHSMTDIKVVSDYLRAHPTFTDNQGNVLAIFEGLSDPGYQFSTYQSKIETSATFNLVADGGLIFCGFQKGFSSLSPYFGINFSFRSFDSDVPFYYLKRRLQWYERLSVHLGLTVNTLAKDKFRSNLFGTNNLMLGLGYKFSHVVSIQSGGLLFNKLDPNPLLDTKKVNAVPYFGLSINLKIKAALGELSKVFAK